MLFNITLSSVSTVAGIKIKEKYPSNILQSQTSELELFYKIIKENAEHMHTLYDDLRTGSILKDDTYNITKKVHFIQMELILITKVVILNTWKQYF